MIEISQIANVGAFSSTHHTLIELPEGVRHWTLTGIADLSESLKASGPGWRRVWVLLTLEIPGAAPKAVRVEQWAPFVTLEAIAADGIDAQPLHAGWAVESFHLMDPDLHEVHARAGTLMHTATLGCAIKVRGVENCVLRLGYTLHLVGTLEARALQ